MSGFNELPEEFRLEPGSITCLCFRENVSFFRGNAHLLKLFIRVNADNLDKVNTDSDIRDKFITRACRYCKEIFQSCIARLATELPIHW